MKKGSTISRAVFKKAVFELENAFRNKDPLTKDQVNVYFKHLKDLSRDQFERAVDEVIKTDNFFPSIGRIRDVAGADIGRAPRALTMKDIESMQGL